MIIPVYIISNLIFISIQSNEYYEEYYYSQDIDYYYAEDNKTEINTKIDHTYEPKIKIEEKVEPTPEYIEKSSHFNFLDDIFLPAIFNYCSYTCDKPNSKIFFHKRL